MKILLLLLSILLTTAAIAQSSFSDQLAKHREKYKKDLLKSAGGPLASEEELAFVQFYEPDSTYRVTATVQLTPKAEPFEMPTYNGMTRPHVSYAILSFVLDGKPQQLTLYRNLNVIRMPEYRDYLFLPFKDATSGQGTYGGGRYIDFRTGEVQNGQLIIDFNKAYNPYCAFHEGYPCPIPPKQNQLSVAVPVGEKAYGKAH
ncbi:DUF1684 domain-containing protein [Spirosoma foliorum]|uniref:DUF1684 domain-containing protein n=1 Tax=Spirosoma foliorum TaxID=2710596 RepID=A0A7G5GP74_9BACT|nr:DUF1684 domain-containing protein [Spirosoma foliorum]QMW00666.1 DUF1684 domain-containing protein [Spirosoma foliorum]